MRVFLDSNIYIKEIKSTNPNIDYFLEVEKLVKEKKFEIIFPTITQIEVFRNLEIELVNLKKNRELKTTFSVPKHINNGKGNLQSLEKLKQYEIEVQKEYSEAIDNQIKLKKEFSDRILSDYKKLSINYRETEVQTTKAYYRKLKGYPPGKVTDCIGDYLIWELILENCSDQDLIIVTSDLDFFDKRDTNPNKINPFLLEEWKYTSQKNIKLIQTLGELINLYRDTNKIPSNKIRQEKNQNYNENLQYSALNPWVNNIPTGLHTWTSNASIPVQTTTYTTSSTNTIDWQNASANTSVFFCPHCNEYFTWNFVSQPKICSNCGSAVY